MYEQKTGDDFYDIVGKFSKRAEKPNLNKLLDGILLEDLGDSDNVSNDGDIA